MLSTLLQLAAIVTAVAAGFLVGSVVGLLALAAGLGLIGAAAQTRGL